MLARRIPLALGLLGSLGSLSMACTPKQDAKDVQKQEAAPTQKQEDPQPQPASGPTYELIPGEAIGPIRMGMSKADVEALGVLQVHPKFSAMTIPITAYYDEAERARSIEISLMHSDKDVRVGEVTIPRTASIEQIRELLGGCKDPEVNTGASMYSCLDGALFIAIGSGNSGEIWLRTSKSETYVLVPGERIGPVRLGMSKAEIEALGLLETHPQYSAMTVPISVYYDESEQAKIIEISLMHSEKDVMIGGAAELAIPRATGINEIRELLGDCQEPVVNKGATMHSCRDGKMFIAIGSGNPDETWLRIGGP
jgi:hypothetical protein